MLVHNNFIVIHLMRPESDFLQYAVVGIYFCLDRSCEVRIYLDSAKG